MNVNKGRTSALVMSTIAMVIGFSVWSILSPMANDIQVLYGLSGTQKSVLVAVPVILGSIMRIPLGILSDKYSGRKVYAITLLFLVIPLIGASFAESYAALLVYAFFIGMAGTTFAIAITFVSGWYPKEKQGFVLGITGVGNIGTAVAGFAVPVIVSVYSIDAAFRILAVAVIIMTVIFWFGTKERERTGPPKTFRQSMEALKYRQTWILSIFYFLTFGSFVAFGIYLPTLLQDLFEVSSVSAGQRAAGFVILATFVRPVGGMLADKIDPKKLLFGIFSVVTVFAVVLGFFNENIYIFTVSCLSIALVVGLGNGVVFKMVPMVSPSNTGAVTGIVGAAGGLGGFFPPIVLGMLKDTTGSFFYGFIFLALFSLVCLLINMSKASNVASESSTNMVKA
ncbi:MFS transporter [Bacillaceae bacterium S4-13-56]